MKFPYGIADFEAMIYEEYYYADRSQYIRQLEDAGKHLLFLRPRRFGKSLLLGLLENYYDVKKTDQFEALFGQLKISQNPTSRHNQYFVMRWDFSMIDGQGTVEEIKCALHNQINVCIRGMTLHYTNTFDALIINEDDSIASLRALVQIIAHTPYKLYLLIDEYDNFANEVMMAKTSDYEALVRGEGIVKTVFKAIKGLSAGQGIDRVFITGVSPVVMSDISSGYNVAENLSLDPRFAELCGFSEAEVSDVLQQVAKACDLSDEKYAEALDMMRTFYNGYQFGYQPHVPIYNPTLALYFLKALQVTCTYPMQMLDSNLAMDRNRIKYIASLPHGETMIARVLDPDNPPLIGSLADKFGVEDMLFAPKDQPFMASLLYYLGVVTLGERDFMGRFRLSIPNLVIRRLYVERLKEALLPEYEDKEMMRYVAEHFYHRGDIKPLCDFIEKRYFQVFDNRDYRWANELVIKSAFLTILFSDTFYIMDSEQELNKGYTDLSLIIRPDMRQYQLLDHILEFKYLDLNALKMTGEQLRQKSRKELIQLPVVEQALEAAEMQLSKYRTALQQRYQGKLRLHCHAVVGLGFERLVFYSTV